LGRGKTESSLSFEFRVGLAPHKLELDTQKIWTNAAQRKTKKPSENRKRKTAIFEKRCFFGIITV
jgi:hypothetical protein